MLQWCVLLISVLWIVGRVVRFRQLPLVKLISLWLLTTMCVLRVVLIACSWWLRFLVICLVRCVVSCVTRLVCVVTLTVAVLLCTVPRLVVFLC